VALGALRLDRTDHEQEKFLVNDEWNPCDMHGLLDARLVLEHDMLGVRKHGMKVELYWHLRKREKMPADDLG